MILFAFYIKKYVLLLWVLVRACNKCFFLSFELLYLAFDEVVKKEPVTIIELNLYYSHV